jgi:hypothetical protein
MGGLNRGRGWWWEYFKILFFSIFTRIKGSVMVAHGYSEMEIKLDDKIKAGKIFVCIEAEDIPVCSGNVNTVGAIRNSPNSFILYADIKSNTATVHWLVEYTPNIEDLGE